MLPRTVEDFKRRYARDVRDPRACVRLWLDVLAKYVASFPMRIADQMTPAAEMVATCLLNRTGVAAPLPREWVARLRAHPYLLWSYVQGATPENDYTHDLKDLTWAIEPKVETLADRAAVWLRSSGASDPRRVTLVYRQGNWLIEQWEQLLEPVAPPHSASEGSAQREAASEPAHSEGPELSQVAPSPDESPAGEVGFADPDAPVFDADVWSLDAPPEEAIP